MSEGKRETSENEEQYTYYRKASVVLAAQVLITIIGFMLMMLVDAQQSMFRTLVMAAIASGATVLLWTMTKVTDHKAAAELNYMKTLYYAGVVTCISSASVTFGVVLEALSTVTG